MTTTGASSHRRFYQFSLRALLLLVLVCAVACGWLKGKLIRAEKQRAAVAEIARVHGLVLYDWQWPSTADATGRVPEWLRARLGEDFFSDVHSVSVFGSRVTDQWLTHLEPLTEIRSVDFSITGITDEGVRYLTRFQKIGELGIGDTYTSEGITDASLAHLATLPALKRLSLLSVSRVTDAGLVHLKELTDLEELELDDASISDDGLAHLSGLSKLQRLSLRDTAVTDAGLAHLEGLPRLRTLMLDGTKVTDRGLAHLHGMSELQEVWLQRTSVTGRGCRGLRRALPKCKTHVGGRLGY